MRVLLLWVLFLHRVFKNGKLQGNAVYNPVNTTVQTTMAVNPALICMGVALMGIEKKLDKIQQTQQQILGFLEQKNESELKGNLNFLSDVLNNYKFNYDNERYKNNMHIKVLDIRQTSEQNIIFYKKQIGEIINKKSLIHINQQTDRLVSDVQSKLNYYKLARDHALCGGHIKNAILHAAHLAATENRPISEQDLTVAAQIEFQKLGHLVQKNHLKY